MTTPATEIQQFLETDDQIRKIFSEAKLPAPGPNFFKVSALPDSPDECMAFLDTGGPPSPSDQEDLYESTFQVVCRSRHPRTALGYGKAIELRLDAIDIDTITTDGGEWEWVGCWLQTPPTIYSRDSENLTKVSVNFRAIRQPSDGNAIADLSNKQN